MEPLPPLPSVPPTITQTALNKNKRILIISFVALAVVVVLIGGMYLAFSKVRVVNEFTMRTISMVNVPADARSLIFKKTPSDEYYHLGFLSLSRLGKTQALPGEYSSVGTRVFTVMASSSNSSAAGTVDPSKWGILLQSKNAKELPVHLAIGYAPAFIDDAHVVYIAPRGITLYDLTKKISVVLAPFATSTTLGATVAYSPDRTHMAWVDAKTKMTTVARFNKNSYNVMHVFFDVPHPVLTNHYMYMTHASSLDTELWRYSFDGTSWKSLLTLPTTLSLTPYTS